MRISSKNTTIESVTGVSIVDPCPHKAENGVLCNDVSIDVGTANNYTVYAFGRAEGGS